MKKQLIIIGILLLGIGGMYWMAVRSGVASVDLTNTDTVNGENAPAETILVEPKDISVGIYDPAEEPSAVTKLLEKRLQSLGYRVSVVKDEGAAEANSERMTVLFTSAAKDKLVTLKQKGIASAVVRQIESGSISYDLVMAAWSIDDIDWGDMEAELGTYRDVKPESVAVLVLNAGAETGEAGRIADVLKGAGYTQAAGESAESEATGPSVVYYQRNFRTVAKKIVTFLRANGYADATYRARQDQTMPIVIVLTAGTPTSTAPNP
ncbi:MAG: LytR C-terminal domain-containing protein [Candidatus Komeilibacteria bacterium]|nr:LytR C-terminal domain-containing protein [Candidatus Komeilibacteria bacterium]